jgi:two-component system, NtrC family, response regulator HydG
MPKISRNEVVIVVDDSPDTLEVLHRSIEHMGFTVYSSESAAEAIELLKDHPADLVITDYHMPFIGGLDLIKHVRDHYPQTEVMMITGYASVEGAVEAIKAGAEEYLAKPFTDEELAQAIERSLEKLSIRADRKGVSTKSIAAMLGLVEESGEMKKVAGLIKKAAESELPVLLAGEPGSGKELAARVIHYESDKSNYPFIYVNCRDIPESILENELFGYVKSDQAEVANESEGDCCPGRFTQPGFFELAGRGTVYLDEISKTSLAVQVKLLDVIAKKELTCVGDNATRPVNCRVIASSAQDLITLTGKGVFREDLFFRLNVINITLPPLRERKNDILPFCRDQLTRACLLLGRSAVPVFSDEAEKALTMYEWPGNLRELIDLMSSLAAKVEGDLVELADLPCCMGKLLADQSKAIKSLHEVEVSHIKEVLHSVNGNKTRAAQILGIDRKTLRDKLNRNNG